MRRASPRARWAARSLCLALLGSPASVFADPSAPSPSSQLGVTTAELADLQAQLGLASDKRREAALGELLALGHDDLPSIRDRLRVLAASPREHKVWLSKLPLLRRTRAVEVKATREDQAVGLLAALESDRSPAMLTVVELIALLRALEAQHSIEASQLIVEQLFALEPRLFRGELVRTRQLLGKLLVPGYLRARAQMDLPLQKIARDGLAALSMSGDANLFGQANPELLAAIVQVESDVARPEALPWIVGLLDDTRPAVREAARSATRSHVDQALDLLRQRMTDLLGEEPDPSWSASELLARLLQQVDSAHDRATVAALQAAQPGLRSGDLDAVERQLDLALERGTSASTQALAAASYLELATRYDQLDQAERALRANRRALRLAPNGSEDEKRARARVLYLEAERRAGQGIADLTSLQEAAQLEPSRSAADELLQELRGLRIDREHEQRKLLGLAAASLLAIAALLILHMRAQARRDRRSASASTSGTRTTKSASA